MQIKIDTYRSENLRHTTRITSTQLDGNLNNHLYLQGLCNQEMASLTDCAICQEEFTNPKQLPCTHTFCLKCLEELLRIRPRRSFTCPECRMRIKVTESYHYLQCHCNRSFPNKKTLRAVISETRAGSLQVMWNLVYFH